LCILILVPVAEFLFQIGACFKVLFYDSGFGSGGMSGYYSSLDGTGGGGGGGYGGGYGGSGDGSLDYDLPVIVDDMVEIEAEYIYNLPE
jgi:hypothetical protein